MKKHFIFIMSLSLMAMASAQVADQNPNYEVSLQKYSAQLYDTPNTMATTVQQTYKAVDEWQDKLDAKAENRNLRGQRRQDRRMGRINQNGYYSASPGIYYGYPYYGGYGYSNYNNGLWGASAYYNGRIGATVRWGNVFIGL